MRVIGSSAVQGTEYLSRQYCFAAPAISRWDRGGAEHAGAGATDGPRCARVGRAESKKTNANRHSEALVFLLSARPNAGKAGVRPSPSADLCVSAISAW